MKPLFAIILSITILISFVMVSCGKTDDFDKLPEPPPPVVISSSSVSVDSTPAGLEATYIYEAGNLKYTVMFDLFKNEHHPRGYVIITGINIGQKDDLYALKTVYGTDPEKYITSIHNISNFFIRFNGETKDLTDKLTRGHFRTAEAIIMAAKQQGIKVFEPEVKEAGCMMIGNTVGKSIGE